MFYDNLHLTIPFYPCYENIRFDGYTIKHACCKGNLRGKYFLANSQRIRKGIATKKNFLAKRS